MSFQAKRTTLSLVLTFLWSHCAVARLVNITVDDTNPDPLTGNTFVYSPQNLWNIGNGCASCTAKPNPAQAFDATWHDATFDLSVPATAEVQTATFQFNGECILV